MHFLDWALEQQGEPGVAGSFGRVIYQDINNGCGNRFTNPMEWREHFNAKHKRTTHVLCNMLEEAYESYLNRFNAEK
jgi:hypothetical protein